MGSVAANEVETVYPKEEVTPKHEEKTVHSLSEPQATEPTNAMVAEPKHEEPVEEVKPQEEVVANNEDIVEDDTPHFEPTSEPTPTAPIQETPQSPRYDDERPVVRVFDNPFSSSSSDDEGFEITSRIITQEEVQARTEQEIAVLEAKKAKETDPKEQLKKQRLRALSMNFRTTRGLEELENQPAYLRRNVEISQSDESDLSHYSTSQSGNSSENSFLHDNVD